MKRMEFPPNQFNRLIYIFQLKIFEAFFYVPTSNIYSKEYFLYIKFMMDVYLSEAPTLHTY